MSVFYTKNKKDNNKIQRSIPKKDFNYENQEIRELLNDKIFGFFRGMYLLKILWLD